MAHSLFVNWLGLTRITDDGTTTTLDSQVAADSVRGVAVTYANRPATAVTGMLVTFTDSNTTTWGATIAGGGANTVLGFYNGTNWTVAGA